MKFPKTSRTSNFSFAFLSTAGFYSIASDARKDQHSRNRTRSREETMPEFHSEPYLHLAGLTHKSALIAWGAFYFRIKGRDGEFKLVDDSSLKKVHPPRKQTIGSSSEPYDDQ